MNISTPSPNFVVLLCNFASCYSSLLTQWLLICFLSVYITSPFLEFYIIGIVYVPFFFSSLFSYSIITLRFTPVIAHTIIHFFYYWVVFHCVGIPRFIHLFVERMGLLTGFGCYRVAMNISIQVFMWMNFYLSWVNT